MKIKLIESNFDRETGVSYAKIQTDYGVFAGSAKLHEEDKEHVSSFAGCHYAETRAIIAYMKHRVKLLNERIKSLENCKKVLENRKEYDHNSVENRTIRKQIYLLKKQKAEWIQRISSLSEKLYQMMMQRDKVVIKLKGDGK